MSTEHSRQGETQSEEESSSSSSGSPPPTTSMKNWIPANYLINLDPLQYAEEYRVMVEYLAQSRFAAPLTRTPPSNFPLPLFEHSLSNPIVEQPNPEEDPVIRVPLENDQQGIITRSTFLTAIGVAENSADFVLDAPTDPQFLQFLDDIGYNGVYTPREFKKNKMPGIWALFLHLLWKGLSGRTSGADSFSREWLNIAFSVYTDRPNAIDLASLLWKDFVYYFKRRSGKVSTPRFWALVVYQLYLEREVPLEPQPKEMKLMFVPMKPYKVPGDQSVFGPIRRLPEHMLTVLPADSPHRRQHLAATNPSIPAVSTPATTSIPPETETLEVPKCVKSLAHKKVKLVKKRKTSPPPHPKPKRTKTVDPSSKGSKTSFGPDSGPQSTQSEPVPEAAPETKTTEEELIIPPALLSSIEIDEARRRINAFMGRHPNFNFIDTSEKIFRRIQKKLRKTSGPSDHDEAEVPPETVQIPSIYEGEQTEPEGEPKKISPSGSVHDDDEDNDDDDDDDD